MLFVVRRGVNAADVVLVEASLTLPSEGVYMAHSLPTGD